jgi:hypothetical protein
MTRPSKPLPSREAVDKFLAERHQDYRPGEPFEVISDLSKVHEAYHRIVVRMGRYIRSLHEDMGLSLRQIDRLFGIDAGKSQRWMRIASEQPEVAEDWKP